MKVLRKGSDWNKEATCGAHIYGGCGSLLLVAEEDFYGVHLGEEGGCARAFKCPVCNRENYFLYKDLPREVFSRTSRAKPYKKERAKQ